MGIHDRDYYRQPPPRYAVPALRSWSVTTWLIVANVAVFVLNGLLVVTVASPDGTGGVVVRQVPLLWSFGYFSVESAVYHGQVWRFLTFQFLHASPGHILFNMISLFFFGPYVEPVLGRARYLAFYLVSGVAGGVSLCLCHWLNFPFAYVGAQLVGASAGIFGVLVAAAFVAPDVTLLVFGIFPVPIRTGAWGMIAIAAYTVLTGGFNPGGQAAHLGGAAAGYGLITNPKLFDVFVPRRGRFGPRPPLRYRR